MKLMNKSRFKPLRFKISNKDRKRKKNQNKSMRQIKKKEISREEMIEKKSHNFE